MSTLTDSLRVNAQITPALKPTTDIIVHKIRRLKETKTLQIPDDELQQLAEKWKEVSGHRVISDGSAEYTLGQATGVPGRRLKDLGKEWTVWKDTAEDTGDFLSRKFKDLEDKLEALMQKHDTLEKDVVRTSLPATGRIVRDAMALCIRPSLESRDDRQLPFLEEGADLMKSLNIDAPHLFLALDEIAIAGGEAAHVSTVATAARDLTENFDFELTGLSTTTVEILRKFLLYISKCPSLSEAKKLDNIQLNGTFSDWKKSNENRAERAKAGAKAFFREKKKQNTRALKNEKKLEKSTLHANEDLNSPDFEFEV